MGCKQERVESNAWASGLVVVDVDVYMGNGEGGLIWRGVPSCIPSPLLVNVSLVPSVQVLSGEGESGNWCRVSTSRGRQPPSGWGDTSKLRGSNRSPNGAPATPSPAASSNNLSRTASPGGSKGSKVESKVESGGPLIHSGGS